MLLIWYASRWNAVVMGSCRAGAEQIVEVRQSEAVMDGGTADLRLPLAKFSSRCDSTAVNGRADVTMTAAVEAVWS